MWMDVDGCGCGGLSCKMPMRSVSEQATGSKTTLHEAIVYVSGSLRDQQSVKAERPLQDQTQK